MSDKKVLSMDTPIAFYQVSFIRKERIETRTYHGTLGDFWAANESWLRWGTFRDIRKALRDTDRVVWSMNGEPFGILKIEPEVEEG